MNKLLLEVGTKEAAQRLIKKTAGWSVAAAHDAFENLELALKANLTNHPPYLAELAEQLMGLSGHQALAAVSLANDTILLSTAIDPDSEPLTEKFRVWKTEARLAGAYEAA